MILRDFLKIMKPRQLISISGYDERGNLCEYYNGQSCAFYKKGCIDSNNVNRENETVEHFDGEVMDGKAILFINTRQSRKETSGARLFN